MDEYKLSLPAHIAFSQSTTTKITHNLSNSCAQSMTVNELCSLAEKSIGDIDLSYAPLLGDIELRKAIVSYHNQINHADFDLEHNNVLTFCGAQEALSAIYKSLLTRDDEVVVFTPCYPSLTSMVKASGAMVKCLELRAENNWQIDFNQLEYVVNDKTKMIVINSPHNPTGSIVDSQTADKILALAKKYQCYLLADDVSQATNYQKLALSHNYLSYEKSIVVSVMAKSFGLAGLRIGWVITKNALLLKELLAIKSYGSICCSAIDEQLSLLALNNSEKIFKRNNDIIQQNIEHFQLFIDNNEDYFSWCPPQAGVLAVVELLMEQSVVDWAKTLAEKSGLLILPCSLFGLSGNYFRLGLGQKDFLQGLRSLEKSLRQPLVYK
ncbi:MAG: aminotransferase class I/II-fold pyridoxal phosphate-dependent enzyme [Colwellia sp.]|nr:aminotransferase class I/II-fold pyridoxal phosphate-dependent enzyme [Colwellia sp.]